MWFSYEAEKRRLQSMNLSPVEYEKQIKSLLKRLEEGEREEEMPQDKDINL
jgi:hypothetical protein